MQMDILYASVINIKNVDWQQFVADNLRGIK